MHPARPNAASNSHRANPHMNPTSPNNHSPPPNGADVMKSLVQKFLFDRPHEAGQTVQFDWFIFRIAKRGQPPRIESLDFRKMASFTEDFSEAERIHSLQLAVLSQFGVVECPCTLRQFALVSASYTPGRDDVFIERQRPAGGNDSGWYVGVFEDSRDMDDATSFNHRSLYELTIHDMRLASFWLLSPGTRVPLIHELQLRANAPRRTAACITAAASAALHAGRRALHSR